MAIGEPSKAPSAYSARSVTDIYIWYMRALGNYNIREAYTRLPRTPTLPAMITAGQIRAARALIGWTQMDLAKASGVSEISIKNIERGATDPRSSTLGALQQAFEKAGVIFLEPGDIRDGGAGVRLKKVRRG
jgi:DNA-binding XRE family transcriptional regulator